MLVGRVIDASEQFKERRFRAEAARNFERVKARAKREYGADIEYCREAYEQLLALVWKEATEQRVGVETVAPFLLDTHH